MKWAGTLFWMILFLFAIIFLRQNMDLVTLRFSLSPIQDEPFFVIQNVPAFALILGGLFVGLLVGGIGDLFKRLQLKKTLRQSQKRIEHLEKEIESLHTPALDRPASAKRE